MLFNVLFVVYFPTRKHLANLKFVLEEEGEQDRQATNPYFVSLTCKLRSKKISLF